MSYLFLSQWGPREPSQTLQDIATTLITVQNLIVNVVAEDTAHLSHRTWSSQDGTDMEASFLLASFHGVRGFISSIRWAQYSTILPSCESCELWLAWQDMTTDAT